MSAVSNAIPGFVVETFLFACACGVIYRLWGGRFLIPKREIILPYQRGVLVQGNETIRVVGPGVCWVKPKQRLMLCDARPRPLQMIGFEALANDNAILRFSVSGEYAIADAGKYLAASSNAADAFIAQLQRTIKAAGHEQSGATLLASPEWLTDRVRELIVPRGEELGIILMNFHVWDMTPYGYLQLSSPQMDTGLVH